MHILYHKVINFATFFRYNLIKYNSEFLCKVMKIMHEVYDLGMILKELRLKAGLSQKQLGEKINRDKGIISRYESNLQTPSFETMRDFSRIFNVSMDYLAGFERHDTITTFKLTDEQSAVLLDLSEIFRRHNENIGKMTEEEYAALGKVYSCLMR